MARDYQSDRKEMCPMSANQFQLCRTGVLLFLYGLLLGFAIAALPNRHAALTAHTSALQMGTFLLAVAFLWERLTLSAKATTWLARLLSISFVVLEVGLTLPATVAADAPRGPLQLASGLLSIGGSVVMLIVLATIAFAFRRSTAVVATR
jgi:hydroxylaminobenzene mutase